MTSLNIEGVVKMKNNMNFIDLFAGCGGLTEGFYKEGFTALTHVEIDKYACETLRERMRYYRYDEAEINNWCVVK